MPAIRLLTRHVRPGADVEYAGVEVSETTELDYFDQHDLGQLRRRLRRAIEDFQREREVYVEIIQHYLEVLSANGLEYQPVHWFTELVVFA